jgi:hypothetical protein
MPTFGQSNRTLLSLVASASLAFAIVSVTACGNPTGVTERVTTAGVRYTSEPSVVTETPLVLVDTVVLTNVSQHSASVTYSGCVVLMRAYRSADRSGAPVYDQANEEACLAYVARLGLAPGASATFVGSLSGAGLQAAGVPPGHYWFASVVLVNDTKIELAAGDANFSS